MVLNNSYQRTAFVDAYESLIWTERFSSWGDFSLILQSTGNNKLFLPEGTYLGLSESDRVMEVETVQDTVDDEGRAILKITGRSIEYILDNRLARGTMGDLTTTPKWSITGLPKAIATQIFHDICVTGILDVGDKIPLIHEGSIYPPDTLPEPPDSVIYEMDPKTVYAAEKDLCDLFHMGFRLVKKQDLGELWFDIYTGTDRTTRQSILPAVVFSADLNNLKNTNQISTTATYKNVAYVLSPVGSRMVYGFDVDPAIAGFDRRILVVRADDIKDTDSTIANARMDQRGAQELGKNRRLMAIDGEISQNSQYKYGRDYNLGDLVEMKNPSGAISSMQVTEQIFVSDKEGKRSYPTLSVNQFIMPGTWMAVPTDKVWADGGPTEYWETS
jgi:hypothetical protein